MKYKVLPEFEKHANEFVPLEPRKVRVFNLYLSAIQKAVSPYEHALEIKKIKLSGCSAQIIKPKGAKNIPCLVYLHGGAFVLKASAAHKNNAKEYAYKGNMAVLLVDYRLAPKHKFPIPVEDCYEAYLWAREQFAGQAVFVGGDSAGGNLALAVTRRAMEAGVQVPDKQLLIYPVCDTRMATKSMKQYVDTPIWNAERNRQVWKYYVEQEELHNVLVSPAEAKSLRGFPPTYIETAEFDCLRDEGIQLAERLGADGVAVELINTKGTIHGYDVEEQSPYIMDCRKKRVAFLTSQA